MWRPRGMDNGQQRPRVPRQDRLRDVMPASAAQTRAERLAAEIADAILNGDLCPGARLDEQMLAKRYGVSRTPVQEALRQLRATGLIDIRPHRGATVAQVTAAELEEMFGAMAELEATCARRSAISMTSMSAGASAGCTGGWAPWLSGARRPPISRRTSRSTPRSRRAPTTPSSPR
jgi:DNA-binding transcriptional regulator YhcF (GntR family)